MPSLPEQRFTLREANLSLILDSYDELFSDFDPRPFAERGLSDDFLAECRKVVHNQSIKLNEFELRLLIPAKVRDRKAEKQIVHRLRTHFQKHHHENEGQIKKDRAKGLLWFLFGIALSLGATLLHEQSSFVLKLSFVMLEPAGWFTIWTGLEKLFLREKSEQADYNFYRKMAHAKIEFLSY